MVMTGSQLPLVLLCQILKLEAETVVALVETPPILCRGILCQAVVVEEEEEVLVPALPS